MNEGIAMRIKNRDIKRTTFRLGGDKWLRRPPPVACGESENMSSSFFIFRIVWFFVLENGRVMTLVYIMYAYSVSLHQMWTWEVGRENIHFLFFKEKDEEFLSRKNPL